MLLSYMRLADRQTGLPPDAKTVSLLASALAVQNALPLLGECDTLPKVAHRPSGQPYIEGHEDICISISHSGGHILVGASEKRIGVDVEVLAARREAVERRAFSRTERMYVQRSRDADRAFFEVWTRKEAYAKACSEGIKRVMLAIVCDDIGLEYKKSGLDGRALYFKTYDDVDDAVISICCEEKSFPQRVPIFEPDDEWLTRQLPDWS